MIETMLTAAQHNRITGELQNRLQRTPMTSHEMLKLKHLGRQDLMFLMMFTDIRVFNDLPVIAMEDDEMRMAYLVWRYIGIEEEKEKSWKTRIRLRKSKRFLIKHLEGVVV